jgi:hypothetical protein
VEVAAVLSVRALLALLPVQALEATTLHTLGNRDTLTLLALELGGSGGRTVLGAVLLRSSVSSARFTGGISFRLCGGGSGGTVSSSSATRLGGSGGGSCLQIVREAAVCTELASTSVAEGEAELLLLASASKGRIASVQEAAVLTVLAVAVLLPIKTFLAFAHFYLSSEGWS